MIKILIATITLDGKITKDIWYNIDWTSEESKNFLYEEGEKAKVVIFGIKSYQVIGQPVLNALNIIMTRNPRKYQKEQKADVVEFTADPPQMILDRLAQRGLERVVLAGGQSVYSLFLQEKLIDEMYLILSPKIFGSGVNLFSRMGIDEINLRLLDFYKLGKSEVLLKYKFISNPDDFKKPKE